MKGQDASDEAASFTEMIKDVKGDRLNDSFIRAGLKALDKNDLVAASEAFNRALKFEPANAHLHFLNAMTYHLQVAGGDSSKLDNAKVGYDLALRYDPNYFWAAYQLGLIHFTEQHFRDAQDAFSYALLTDPENPIILRALATASYYAQDLETAISAIEKASELDPSDEGIIYTSAMINAAAGRGDKANAELALYADRAGEKINPFRKEHLTKRVQDWKKFHDTRPHLQLAASTSDIFGSDASQGLKPGSSKSHKSSKSGKSDDDDKTKADHKSMVLIDVIIIRSEERTSTIKGVNLLNGLTSTLSGTLWSYSDTKTVTRNDTFDVNTARSTVYTIAPSFSIAASYALNIFNDDYDKNDVLARPTLVALNNKKSDFFSGAVFHVELTGASGSQGAVQAVPVGIKLEVTPKFWETDEVELKVKAARAFVEGRSSNPGFNNFMQVSKTLLSVNVTMKFDDTLVLSGLSEKETENLRDGVPFLQDIPGLQYIFGNKTTLDYTKSVLILMTPRKPRYTYEDGTVKIDPENPVDRDAERKHLHKLKHSTEWHKPADTVDAVLWHLKDSKFVKEFRSGDVRMEKWHYPGRIRRMTERAIEFLYW
ncbi:MAG: hypothetical protein ACE5FQ_11660 [Thiogranum sp.]